MTGLGYVLVCPLAYVLAGGSKFLINSATSRRLAFDQIGLGRFPSTHTAIASAPAWAIALREGANTPAFAVAVGVAMIVAIDAMDLRRKVEQINTVLRRKMPGCEAAQKLRPRVGHKPLEVLGGIAAGGIAAGVVNFLS